MKKLFAAMVGLLVAGCGSGDTPVTTAQTPKSSVAYKGAEPFRLTLYASEYPSWSTFGVASRQKLIDGAPGKLGPIEQKYNVDLEVKMVTYEVCLTEYGTTGGAVCITNTDIVGLVAGRPSTAIMPTSTSFGADACIGINGIDTVEELQKETTYGLANSVSDYAWFRCLEKLGKNPADFKFANRDPEQAAQALQTGQSNVGQVWNPFTVQTLRNKKDAKTIFTTVSIPGEVVDMVCMDNDTLAKGGPAAALCVIETFYKVCDNLKSPDKALSDDTYTALGDQFAKLSVEDMRLCADMASQADPKKELTTRFYDTPALGAAVFEKGTMEPVMEHIVRWAKIRQLVKDSPVITYGAGQGGLTFDPQYMRMFQGQ